MDISPQRVRTAEFRTVKKGLDPDEVRAFLNEVATELERAQNQSTAMEARARAAVARLQEISEATPAAEPPAPAPAAAPAVEQTPAPVAPSVDEAETISRTLLLAQRTADTTIAEAEAEAERLRSEAASEAEATRESMRTSAEQMLNEAREEARRRGAAERMQVESEVNALMARRDFLESDVDHLETFLVEERSRLRDAASSILELVERVPSGLGEVRRPLLSAADDEEESDADDDVTATEGAEPESEVDETDDADAGDESGEGADESDDDDADDPSVADTTTMPLVPGGSAPSPSTPDQLVIRTDIADEGPTGFSYDNRDR